MGKIIQFRSRKQNASSAKTLAGADGAGAYFANIFPWALFGLLGSIAFESGMLNVDDQTNALAWGLIAMSGGMVALCVLFFLGTLYQELAAAWRIPPKA